VNDLKGLKKEDLIKKFTAIRLGKILGECKNSRNLNNMNSEPEAKRRDDSGKVSIKINIGKKHNLDIKGFFSLVNSGGHKERIDIGRIKLLPAITIFSVDPEKADKVVRGLQGKNFKGTRINAVRK
jgi:hypothetical protein